MASANLIILGEDDERLAPNAFLGVAALSREIQGATGSTRSFGSVVKSYDALIGSARADATFSVSFDCKAVLSLLGRPWFRRLWIVQEAALARSNTCYWGNCCSSLEDILRVAMWLRYKRFSLDLGLIGKETFGVLAILFDILDGADGVLRTIVPQQDGSVALLLGALRDFEASDARDHIYGVMGLYGHHFPTGPPLSLQPDYSKSPAKVFAEATKLCLWHDEGLVVWQYIRHRQTWRYEDQLPSWVPRWDAGTDLTSDNSVLALHFDTATGTKARLKLSPEVQWNVVGVDGFILDTVVKCSPVCDTIEVWAAFLVDSAASWVGHSAHDISSAATQAMNRTLLGDHVDGERARSEDLESLEHVRNHIRKGACVEALFPWTRDCEDCGIHDSTDNSLDELCRYAVLSWSTCAHRRLFATSQGGIGLGPATLHLNDTIVVLYGGETAYALRSCAAPGFHNLIGQCYVDDIMHGEAMLRHQSESGRDETFMLV